VVLTNKATRGITVTVLTFIEATKYAAATTDHGKQLAALFDGPASVRYFVPLDV